MATVTIINICYLRTMTLRCSPELTLKLAIEMKISSALRTISHFTAYAGPRFGRDIVPHLAIDRQVLVLEEEVASAVYFHKDPEVAKHCTAIIRKPYDGKGNGGKLVLAATLTEKRGYGDKAGEVHSLSRFRLKDRICPYLFFVCFHCSTSRTTNGSTIFCVTRTPGGRYTCVHSRWSTV
ncbi:hypothetical protein JB92DRAFT_1900480 [Gautieria morchelliformis]|nr:hypothetical protein JB92DRAFT_1900480 [Gautieria morchelliformis]